MLYDLSLYKRLTTSSPIPWSVQFLMSTLKEELRKDVLTATPEARKRTMLRNAACLRLKGSRLLCTARLACHGPPLATLSHVVLAAVKLKQLLPEYGS